MKYVMILKNITLEFYTGLDKVTSRIGPNLQL